jgi:hypothetical protein
MKKIYIYIYIHVLSIKDWLHWYGAQLESHLSCLWLPMSLLHSLRLSVSASLPNSSTVCSAASPSQFFCISPTEYPIPNITIRICTEELYCGRERGGGRGKEMIPSREPQTCFHASKFPPSPPGNQIGFHPAPGNRIGFHPAPGNHFVFYPFPQQPNCTPPSPWQPNSFPPSPWHPHWFPPSPLPTKLVSLQPLAN